VLENQQRPNMIFTPIMGDNFYSSPEWSALKKKAYKRYGRKCAATGLTEKDGITLSVDHVLPRSKAPHLALKLSNVQVLELGLNKTKSNRANWDFRPVHWRLWYWAIKWIKRALVVVIVGVAVSTQEAVEVFQFLKTLIQPLLMPL